MSQLSESCGDVEDREDWEASAAERDAQFQSLLDQLAKLQQEKTEAEVKLTRFVAPKKGAIESKDQR